MIIWQSRVWTKCIGRKIHDEGVKWQFVQQKDWLNIKGIALQLGSYALVQAMLTKLSKNEFIICVYFEKQGDIAPMERLELTPRAIAMFVDDNTLPVTTLACEASGETIWKLITTKKASGMDWWSDWMKDVEFSMAWFKSCFSTWVTFIEVFSDCPFFSSFN